MESDRRFNQITPTAKAWELDAALLSSIKASESQMTSGFSEEEHAALYGYLCRIIDNLTQQGGQA